MMALALGCSSTGGASGDGRVFVPETVPANLQEGERGVSLKLVAFTLVQGTKGPEFYAAVKNDGAVPSCNAGMMTELFDEGGNSLAMVGSALRGKQLYRLGTDTLLDCLDPGAIGMAASTGFAPDVTVSSVAALKYRFPTFEVDGIEALKGITFDAIRPVAAGGGTGFQGTLRNDSTVAVRNPNALVFALNRVGRPLGAGFASATRDLAPGDTWAFETSAVAEAGVDAAAFVSLSIAAY
jgi:hypothetical protein